MKAANLAVGIPLTKARMRRMPIRDLSAKIASVLSPNLLLKNFRDADYHPAAGHCYVATEALYHLIGGKKSDWAPMRGKDIYDTTHWWLRHKETKEIVDPTAAQYTDNGMKPPYAYGEGRGGGFLTAKPSWRAREVIRRLKIKTPMKSLLREQHV